MLPRRFLAFLAPAVFLAGALIAPVAAQQKTSLVLSAGPTGGTWTPMAAATAEVMKGVTAKDMAPSLGQPIHPGAEKYYREAGLLK